ncbi:MAG: sugar nucleotide-binding protein [Planctomycetia bacterium]|nr:sugar nucleotide-binding protein [Planctomycetia bacterium]
MHILVLGAHGMLGHAMVASWRQFRPDDTITALDLPDLDLGNRLTTMDQIELHRPDVIINAAGINDINWLQTHPNSARTIHLVGTTALCDAARKIHAKLVQISCAEVFHRESPGLEPPREEDEPEPNSIFGRTKREQERIALDSPNALVVRTGLLFDDLRPTGAGNVVESVLRVARRTRSFSVLADVETSLTRTRDLVLALASLVHADGSGIWHVAGRGTPTLLDIATFLLNSDKKYSEHTITPITLKEYGHPAPHSHSTTLNCDKYHRSGAFPPLPLWTDALNLWLQETRRS